MQRTELEFGKIRNRGKWKLKDMLIPGKEQAKATIKEEKGGISPLPI